MAFSHLKLLIAKDNNKIGCENGVYVDKSEDLLRRMWALLRARPGIV